MNNKAHLTVEGLNQIVNLKASPPPGPHPLAVACSAKDRGVNWGIKLGRGYGI
jgi:hypothetical protein